MKNVALVGVDTFGRVESDHLHHFFYSLRKLEAALVAGDTPLDADVNVVEATRREPDAIAEEILALDPDLVGMSAYVWSFATLVEVARRVKRARPDTAIVFGGPSGRVDMFRLPAFADAITFVDAIVPGEGEQVLRDLVSLPRCDRASIAALPGIDVPSSLGWRRTPGELALPEMDRLPSPYELGLVSSSASGYLETFRNCPLACRFCTWGATGKASRVFPIEHTVRELRAFDRLGLPGVILLDAGLNLNAQAFRQLEAAEREVGFLRGRHFHTELYPSTVSDAHLAFLDNARSTVGIGLQSFNAEVLALMDRPARFNRFADVAARASEVSHVTAELILGMPGDSPASFRASLERALELGVCVDVSHCLVLPDALLSRSLPEFAIDFDPQTMKMRSCLGWTEEDLRREAEHTIELCGTLGGFPDEYQWRFACGRGELCPATTNASHASVDREVRLTIDGGAIVLSVGQDGVYRTTLETHAGPVVLEMRQAASSPRSYRVRDGVAFSYVGKDLSKDALPSVDSAIERLRVPVAALFDGR